MSHYKQLFFTANGRFFFTMPPVVAMQRMAMVMVVMTRRKIRFPTGVATVTKKAKPTTAAMAFCVYIILYYVLLRVTPSILFGYTRIRVYKKICVFSGLRPLRLCVLYNISRASSRLFRATPIRTCLMAG